MNAPMCRLCKTRHYGLCQESPSTEDLREMIEKKPARKAPAKKIVSIPPMPSPETLAEITAIAGVILPGEGPPSRGRIAYVDPVPTQYANLMTDLPPLPTTQSPPATNEGPPSWWRATESPVYCEREPDKTPDERRRWMIESLRLEEQGHRWYSSIADEMEAMLAEIEELKKYDRRAYQRQKQKESRERRKAK